MDVISFYQLCPYITEGETLSLLDEPTSNTTSFAECGASKAQMATSDPTHTWPPLPNCTTPEIHGASQPSSVGTSLKTQQSQATSNPPTTSPQVATMVAPTPSLRNTTKPPTYNVALVPSLKPHHPKSTKPPTCGCVCGTFSQTTPP